uniref:Condensin-2 complex subunit H2 n=1 Tax=Peronospora matthiolae TaxID=2874970 RepID=A0AAV1TB65_9STRA
MSGGRLQHLLQPLRDLSKNWNIDLATELEDYMDKLETLSIAFDPESGSAQISRDGEGGATGVMNFAEAALLIQGTSLIYSRKVEYLHALVYQTLAHLSQQQDDNQQSQERGKRGTGETQEDENGAAASVLDTALLLYDELEEAKPSHITLKSAVAGDGECDGRGGGRKRKEAKALHRSKNNMEASIALMGSLVPDERDHGETYKLLSCNLHASGVLLLDEASKKYLGAQQRVVESAFGETPGRYGGMWVAADGDEPATALNFDDMDANDNNDNDDDAGMMNPFDKQPDYEFDAGESMQDACMENARDDAQQQRNAVHENSSRAAVTAMPVSEKDLWAPLDAYDASTSVALPFKKGRSYPRVPVYKKRKADLVALNNKEGVVGVDDDAVQDGLSDPAFLDRFFMGSNGLQWASWVWTETASENPLEKACRKMFCRTPLLAKSCDVLWQREAKWRSIMRRSDAREKQSAEAMLLREQATEEEEAVDEHDQMRAFVLSTGTARLGMAFRNDASGNRDDEDGDDNDYNDGFDGGDVDQVHVMDEMMRSYEAEAAASSFDGPLTYDEICRQHLASFMSGTEKYVRETDLSKQVSEWQEKLTPLLKQQDAHPPFDIHHYGREIIGRLEEEHKSFSLDKLSGSSMREKLKRARLNVVSEEEEEERDTVPFETLVDGKSQFEVCRVFLATLQLANSGNVSLLHAHTTAEHEQVPFEMQLLTSANTYGALQA